MIRSLFAWFVTHFTAPNPESYAGEFNDIMTKGSEVARMRENSISRAMRERGPRP